eukprot:TRINITY_DN66844_c7_g8_i1.p1 TRINITY_DN66844_c7_g8~~TRINITY_DN66844_c7_g8_i1.p1  ORF type:complete len:194 (+),score=7.61 TRINITY_DN66844_c7_g8_i1:23-604(+)
MSDSRSFGKATIPGAPYSAAGPEDGALPKRPGPYNMWNNKPFFDLDLQHAPRGLDKPMHGRFGEVMYGRKIHNFFLEWCFDCTTRYAGVKRVIGKCFLLGVVAPVMISYFPVYERNWMWDYQPASPGENYGNFEDARLEFYPPRFEFEAPHYWKGTIRRHMDAMPQTNFKKLLEITCNQRDGVMPGVESLLHD